MSSQRSNATKRRDLEEIQQDMAAARRHLLAIYEKNVVSTDPKRSLEDVVVDAFRERFAVAD